jgi:hypothetical protein
MTRKIRIDNPEDNDLAHHNAKLVIARLFNDDAATGDELSEWVDSNLEVRRFVCAKDALAYYASDGAVAPDLLLCDIDFTEPRCSESATAGIGIVLEVRERFPHTVVAYLTSQEADPLVRNTIEKKLVSLPSESRIVRKDVRSMSDDLRRKLPLLFRRVARDYLERSTLDELESLSRTLLFDQTPLNSVVKVAGEEWILRDLFIGAAVRVEDKTAADGFSQVPAWAFLTDKEFVEEIEHQVAQQFSLTYQFSKCFGRWGIKEITHGDKSKEKSQGYYYTDNRLADCVDKQLVELSNRITEVWGSPVNESIKEFIGKFDLFASTWERNRECLFSKELRDIRNASFQIYGSQVVDYIKSLGGGLSVGAAPEALEGFEINVPIHLILEGAFRNLLNPKGAELGRTEILCTSRRCQSDPLPDLYPAFVFDNYLLVRYERQLDIGEILSRHSESPVDFLATFHNHGIEKYGKYYIIVRDESLACYEAVRNGARLVPKENVFGAESHPLEQMIESDVEFKTNHLFVFTGWRQ